ncbi:hypothetical protein Hanom_Chr01g00053661 [Helianthus anomalus]
MGTMQTWRKAYSALKDQTTVGLAHVNSDSRMWMLQLFRRLIMLNAPPKERHIRSESFMKS